MKAVVADGLGGPENLKYIDLPEPKPGPGEVLIKLEAIGVNFIDTYFRKGIYKVPESPVRLGQEGSGTVAEIGPDASFTVGQRVAYSMVRGAYAEYAAVPQTSVVPLPDAVSFENGASALLQGMTAHYLTHSTFPLNTGHTCLIHAAAGGAGILTLQMARILGATVIATCSSNEKADLVRSNGAAQVIRYDQSDFVAETKHFTAGRGVDVVYDSVGKSTFAKSLDCLKPLGMMVTFGQSSGPIGEIDPLTLMQKGSLFLTRPNLAQYIASPEALSWRSGDVFRWMAEERLKVFIHRVYPLAEAAAAHRELESRGTIGKLILKP